MKTILGRRLVRLPLGKLQLAAGNPYWVLDGMSFAEARRVILGYLPPHERTRHTGRADGQRRRERR